MRLRYRYVNEKEFGFILTLDNKQIPLSFEEGADLINSTNFIARIECPCGEKADYVCDCGCPCCGSDQCINGCGGSVRPIDFAILTEQLSGNITKLSPCPKCNVARKHTLVQDAGYVCDICKDSNYPGVMRR